MYLHAFGSFCFCLKMWSHCRGKKKDTALKPLYTHSGLSCVQLGVYILSLIISVRTISHLAQHTSCSGLPLLWRTSVAPTHQTCQKDLFYPFARVPRRAPRLCTLHLRLMSSLFHALCSARVMWGETWHATVSVLMQQASGCICSLSAGLLLATWYCMSHGAS